MLQQRVVALIRNIYAFQIAKENYREVTISILKQVISFSVINSLEIWFCATKSHINKPVRKLIKILQLLENFFGLETEQI